LVEVFEYTLVFLASLLVGGSSLYTLGSYASHERGIAEASAFQLIVSAASVSLRTGTAQIAVIYLDNYTVSCGGGRISMSSPGGSFSSDIGAPCSFRFVSLKGIQRMEFRPVSGELTLRLMP
jgi:hypothetical protein